MPFHECKRFSKGLGYQPRCSKTIVMKMDDLYCVPRIINTLDTPQYLSSPIDSLFREIGWHSANWRMLPSLKTIIFNPQVTPNEVVVRWKTVDAFLMFYLLFNPLIHYITFQIKENEYLLQIGYLFPLYSINILRMIFLGNQLPQIKPISQACALLNINNIQLNINILSHQLIMKYIVAEQELEIPEGVTIDVKARQVVVKGKLGTLRKAFKHIPIDIRKDVTSKTKAPALKFRMWLQKKKRNAVLGTIRSTIRNMITGVTVGYKFKMVLAYAHFPIVVNVIENGKAAEIKNFLGFKMNKRIDAPEGVIISKKEEEKNNIVIQGINLEDVSQVCARIQQSTVIQDKDLRSFLDGIYVQDARLEFTD